MPGREFAGSPEGVPGVECVGGLQEIPEQDARVLDKYGLALCGDSYHSFVGGGNVDVVPRG